MATAPIRSMTGFGEAERELERGRLRIEIRTVNHRYLSVQIRTPSGIDRHQPKIERALKEYFSRGQVNVSVVVEGGGERGTISPVEVDVERARAYVRAIRALREDLDLQGAVDLDILTRFRDIFREGDPSEVLETLPDEVLLDVVGEAAARVVGVREAEGAHLASDLSERLDAMESEIDAIEELAPARLLAERDRLREAIGALIEGEVTVDDERIAREVAHMAERWDIHEEIVRFRSHAALFREALREGGNGGVGKRLSFIGQELLREANTIGSKANDAEIAHRVVTLKEEIDRVREQVENVE